MRWLRLRICFWLMPESWKEKLAASILQEMLERGGINGILVKVKKEDESNKEEDITLQ